MHIAIIGFGEVGRCYAAALAESGTASHARTISVCDTNPTPGMRALAQQLSTPLRPRAEQWLADADVVLVCTQGEHALAANREAARYMRPGALLADTTTASPEHKRQAASDTAERGVTLVDVAIMGLIASTGPRTPLLVAGDATGTVSGLMESVGSPVSRLTDAAPGDAISLKLLRSIITKGLEALAVEAFTAAERLGVRDQLYGIMTDMDRVPIRDFLDTLVRTHVIHAARRGHEVADAREQLIRAGLTSHVLPGVEALFADSSRALGAHPPFETPPSADEAIAWLLGTRLATRAGTE